MTWIEGIAAICGLMCVWLTVRQNVLCWPTGLVQVILYIGVFYHARLYSDLILHVTLAERLAKEFDTVWMPEYGREYWDAHQVDRRLTLEQLAEIAERHLAKEEALLFEANRYLFTDTNALTTYVFSLYYHGKAHEQLIAYANATVARYDLVFLCDSDIPYDDTWDRSGDGNRQVFQQQIVGDLAERKVPYFILRGALEDRIAYVKQVLSRFRKYRNLLDTVSALPPIVGPSPFR
jgi:HTH-type transcriptional regulator, transcriptional repressor of NAD biosynthesis genes